MWFAIYPIGARAVLRGGGRGPKVGKTQGKAFVGLRSALLSGP